MMKKSILTVIAILAIGFFSNRAFAQATTATPKGDVLDTLSASPDYNVAALAIRAAGLTSTMRGAGPFTIFAPSNIAFSNVPSAKLDAMMKDPAALAIMMRGHVVNGKYDKAAIIKTLGSGTPTLTTIDGKTLTLSVTDKHLTITDSDGNKAKVVAFDMMGTNGVVIGIDAILTK